jgi:hypothetical protein
MFKKLVLFALLATLVVACSNNGAKEQAAVQLSVEKVTAEAKDFVDKNVAVSGTVVHVCRHGGKKMFIIGEDPEKRFKVTANAQVGSFDVALEGSNVTVEGFVQAEVVEVEVEVEKNHEGDEGDQHADGEKEEECEFENVTYYSLDCLSVIEI